MERVANVNLYIRPPLTLVVTFSARRKSAFFYPLNITCITRNRAPIVSRLHGPRSANVRAGETCLRPSGKRKVMLGMSPTVSGKKYVRLKFSTLDFEGAALREPTSNVRLWALQPYHLLQLR